MGVNTCSLASETAHLSHRVADILIQKKWLCLTILSYNLQNAPWKIYMRRDKLLNIFTQYHQSGSVRTKFEYCIAGYHIGRKQPSMLGLPHCKSHCCHLQTWQESSQSSCKPLTLHLPKALSVPVQAAQHCSPWHLVQEQCRGGQCT